jgi:transposase
VKADTLVKLQQAHSTARVSYSISINPGSVLRPRAAGLVAHRQATPCLLEHRMLLFYLPPYSPERNLIEIVWKHAEYH